MVWRACNPVTPLCRFRLVSGVSFGSVQSRFSSMSSGTRATCDATDLSELDAGVRLRGFSRGGLEENGRARIQDQQFGLSSLFQSFSLCSYLLTLACQVTVSP
jgi:hypothetical protein